jgi:hypothetical protein
MLSITHSSHLDLLGHIPQQTTTLMFRYKPLVKKVHAFVFPAYMAGSAVFFTGYGVKEIGWNYKQNAVEHVRRADINNTALPALGYPLVHGSLFVATGIFNAFEALHAFACINLGNKLRTVVAAGNLTFLFANVLDLQENVCLYEQAVTFSKCGTVEKTVEADIQKKSAILGILSNLGYIASTAITLLGVSAGMALLLACFGSCWGGLKILYDFYVAYLNDGKKLGFDLQEKPLEI